MNSLQRNKDRAWMRGRRHAERDAKLSALTADESLNATAMMTKR